MSPSAPRAGSSAPRHLLLTAVLIGVSAACLVAGLLLPAVAFTRFYVLGEQYSLLGAVMVLWQAGEHVLAVIIGVFSVVFPATKLILMATDTLIRLRGGGPLHRIAAAMASLGRWSMLDVFVLALLIVAIRGSGVGDAATLPGIYLFAMSILLTMWAGERLRGAGNGFD